MQVDSRAPEVLTDDLAAMLNASRMCVLVHDAATKNILWANPAACDMLEWDVDELRPLKATHMSSTARQYDRVIGRAWLQEAVDKGTASIEWHYRSRTGRVIPTEAIAIRVEFAQGPAVMVQFRDIEREQEVEQKLRRTSSYMDALAHRTSTIAMMLDQTGTLQFATDSALEVLGADTAHSLGSLENYGTLRLAGRTATWQHAAERADPVTTVQFAVSGTAELMWLEGSLERLQETGGEALLMILHDVSGRVQEEARQKRELQQENYLARYNAMGDMAMAIAHELGQPLAAARNFLSGILRHAQTLGELNERAAAIAEQVTFGVDNASRQIDRASAIVDAVRAFVGNLEHVRQVTDLGEIVAECLYFIQLRADAAEVRVIVVDHPSPIPMWCERVLTGQVVLNFCFNAIDEMADLASDRREVTITTYAEGGEGVLTVEDRGRGLPMDPFAESFTSKEHGSGIGLALSHRIITRQHGRIWAAERPGGGSRFGFALPLADEPRQR